MPNSRPMVLATGVFMLAALVGRAANPASGASLPEVVERGLSAFKVNGGRAAVENWLRAGPLEHSKGENELIDAVQDLQRRFGRYEGFAMVETIRLSPSSQLIYLEVQLAEGPIYFRLRVYEGKQGVHVVGIKVDAVPERILPEFVLEAGSDRKTTL